MNFGLVSPPCLQPFLTGPPGWTLALVHPLTALGAVNGPRCPSALPAELRCCGTVPVGEGMAGTGVTLALQEQPALAVP